MFEKTELYNEIDRFYSTAPRDLNGFYPEIKKLTDVISDPCSRKAALHGFIAEHCGVSLIRGFPFFCEIDCGRDRFTWGTDSPLGNFMKRDGAKNWIAPYQNEIRPYCESGLVSGWSPAGYDHHCPGYDKIIKLGLSGIIAEARERLRDEKDSGKAAFLQAVIDSNSALIKISEKFAIRAAEASKNEKDEKYANIYARISQAAARCPTNPPATFYEALSSILFIRECYGSFEGMGMSTFGHLDRMLLPFYQNDIREGRETAETAAALFHALLTYTDAKFAICDTGYRETSTTIYIGGCDADGRPVYNDLTRAVIGAYADGGYSGTKLVARISSDMPDEYAELLAGFVSTGANTIVFENDDTLIKANVRCGKAVRDARLYVGGGCHEIVLGGTEVNTRADTWINLAEVVLQTLFPDRALTPLSACDDYPDFESFYRAVTDNVQALHDSVASLKTKYELRWRENDPMPLYSSSVADCIENGADITAGGARYNSVSLSMLGAATYIDSLYSIKKLVFDDKIISLNELRLILKSNFEGYDALRAQIRSRFPKHGTSSEELDLFGVRVMESLSRVSGQKNGRGGVFTPAFYPHDLFRTLGLRTPATPDGRGDGEYISRGFSPGEYVYTESVTDIINSLRAFDMSLFPESFATELTLPYFKSPDNGKNVITALIKSFVSAGGSTLQINILDAQKLREARDNPEKYKNLIVRVCGYSQAFNSLSDEQKDEVISRAFRNA